VVRNVNFGNRKIAVVMELWGLNSTIKKLLLRSVAHWARKQDIKIILFQDNNQTLLGGVQIGFIYMPSFLLPKKQFLMVFGKLKSYTKYNWWIQFGDWDGF